MELTVDAALALAALWELRSDNRNLLHGIASEGELVHRTVAWITLTLSDRLSANAPYLTGTLASAHRGDAFANEGYLYIDDTVVNPVMGGFASVYGEEKHLEKPWWDTTFDTEADGILVEGMLMLESDLDDLWT